MKLIHRLRLKLKGLFDRIGNERLKLNLLQAIPFWIASIITGLMAVLYARIFLLAEQSASHIFQQYAWSLFLITPTCFVIAWWLVKRFAPYARGAGIPQVIASIELANPKYNNRINRLLSLRIICIKICSSVIMALAEA